MTPLIPENVCGWLADWTLVTITAGTYPTQRTDEAQLETDEAAN